MKFRCLVLLSSLLVWGCTPSETHAPPKPKASTPAAPSSAPSSQPSSELGQRSSGTSPNRRNDVDPDGVVRRGVDIAHEEALTVQALLQDAPRFDGQTVTVTGEVTQVCAKKGCWMALRSDEGGPSVRVTAQDYAYFVPEDSVGMSATIKGEVSVKMLDKATAEHYAAETKGQAKVTPGPEVAIASVGLELRR